MIPLIAFLALSPLAISTSYHNIDNIDDLYDGQEVIFTSKTNTDIPIAMGAQDSDRQTRSRHQINIDSNDNISLINENTARMIVNVIDSKNFGVVYSFKDITNDNKYISAPGAGNNYISLKDELDATSVFKISFDEYGYATIKSCSIQYTSNILRNSDVDKVFTFYKDITNTSPINIAISNEVVSDTQVVDTFVSRYMYMNSIPSDVTHSEDCANHYNQAKQVYDNFTTSQKELFNTSNKYENAKERYAAWVKANTNNNSSLINNSYDISDYNLTYITIIIVTIISILGIAIINKRKKRN